LDIFTAALFTDQLLTFSATSDKQIKLLPTILTDITINRHIFTPFLTNQLIFLKDLFFKILSPS